MNFTSWLPKINQVDSGRHTDNSSPKAFSPKNSWILWLWCYKCTHSIGWILWMWLDTHGCRERWLLAKKSRKKWTDAVELIAVSNSKRVKMFAKHELQKIVVDWDQKIGDKIFKWDTMTVIWAKQLRSSQTRKLAKYNNSSFNYLTPEEFRIISLRKLRRSILPTRNKFQMNPPRSKKRQKCKLNF